MAEKLCTMSEANQMSTIWSLLTLFGTPLQSQHALSVLPHTMKLVQTNDTQFLSPCIIVAHRRTSFDAWVQITHPLYLMLGIALNRLWNIALRYDALAAQIVSICACVCKLTDIYQEVRFILHLSYSRLFSFT